MRAAWQVSVRKKRGCGLYLLYFILETSVVLKKAIKHMHTHYNGGFELVLATQAIISQRQTSLLKA